MKSHLTKQLPILNFTNKTNTVVLFLTLVLLTSNAFSQDSVVVNHKGTKTTVTSNVVTTSNTAPNNPEMADVWFDNTDIANVITKIYDGSSWVTVEASGGGSGDDLGNHTATENLKLSNHWLSNDGDSEGIYIETDGDVGIGTSSPSEKLEVAGTIDAKALKTTIYTAERTTTYTTVGNHTWIDYPDLTQTITLSEEATIIANFSFSMFVSDSYLAMRLVVSGNNRTKSTCGNATNVYCNLTDTWSETLSAGTHTIKVQYRTGTYRTMDPNQDFQQAFLQVTVIGNQ